jgi:hypothetical protein
VEAAAPKVFGDEDRPEAVKVFEEGERARCCRHCRHYVVNPFVQWCGHHKRETEAPDLCADFSPKAKEQ